MTPTRVFVSTFTAALVLTGVPMALNGFARVRAERERGRNPARARLLVLTHSVEAGATLTPRDVAEKEMPAACADPGALGVGAVAVGRRARVALHNGDVLHATQLAGEVAP